MKIRRGRGERNSFFAVPIRYENKTVGILSIEKEYISEEDFNNTHELVILISTLVSNKTYNYIISKREKDKLLKKNIELKNRLRGKKTTITFIGKNNKILKILKTIDIISDTHHRDYGKKIHAAKYHSQRYFLKS